MSLRVSAERGLERITCSIAIKRLRLFTHGVIPGQSHTEAPRISSPGIDEGRFWALQRQESCNGALCRTGRIAEANSDLHC
jgi:hypothetical protein